MNPGDVSATETNQNSDRAVPANSGYESAMRPGRVCRGNPQWSVLIVDDHELVRVGMRRILEDVESIGRFVEAANGERALELARHDRFDLIFLDLSLPGISGLETAMELLRRWPEVRIIVLTAVREFTFTRQLVDLGVKGYLTKDCDPEQMEKAIYDVMAGRVYLAPQVAQQLAVGLPDPVEKLFRTLTARETEIVLLTFRGLRNRQIAERLFISEKTVSTHRMKALEKLEVKSTAELTRLLHKLDAWDQLTGL